MAEYRIKAKHAVDPVLRHPERVPVLLEDGTEIEFVGADPLEVGDPAPEEVRRHPFLEPVPDDAAPESAPKKTTSRRRTSKKKTAASGGSE